MYSRCQVVGTALWWGENSAGSRRDHQYRCAVNELSWAGVFFKVYIEGI